MRKKTTVRKKFKIIIFDFLMFYLLPKGVSSMNKVKNLNAFYALHKKFLSTFTADAIKMVNFKGTDLIFKIYIHNA